MLPSNFPGDYLRKFTSLLLCFGAAFLPVRVLSFSMVISKHVIPIPLTQTVVFGINLDIALVGFLGFVTLLPYLAVQKFLGKDWAYISFSILAGVILTLYVAVVLYFSFALSPLGANLLAYTPKEIAETIGASGEIGLLESSVLVSVLMVFSTSVWRLRNANWSSLTQKVVLTGSIIGTVIFVSINPSNQNYEKEIEYKLVANKLSYLIEEVWHEYQRHAPGKLEDSLAEQSQQKGNAKKDSISRSTHWTYDYNVDGKRYPLARKPTYRDVLSPYLDTSDRPPNIVIIVMEGLGGSFTGRFAQYGGFTPYLDSLAEKSLNWTHFLSTSSRTFGVFPSILGSLPYGKRGFLESQKGLPNHLSLMSLLSETGYHTGYYTGADASFDNLERFLKNQGIETIMDRADFSSNYERIQRSKTGFSWGYGDKAMFDQAQKFIERVRDERPRLDVYLTLNLHSPFLNNEQQKYLQEFEKVLNDLDPSSQKRRTYENYKKIFATLLYTDDQIKKVIKKYRSRKDFERTIFVITGDHRVAPVPHKNQIDRYYVPFMIYSPLVKKPKTFHSISSHLSVAPTLVNHLVSNYEIKGPDLIHWLNGPIDTTERFHADKKIPFIRNKNQTLDYLSGTYYLSDNRLFEVKKGMGLSTVANKQKQKQLESEFDQFKRVNQFVMSKDRIIPKDVSFSNSVSQTDVKQTADGFANRDDQKVFSEAQSLAWDENYEEALRRLDHLIETNSTVEVDALVLKSRIFGWQGNYRKAKKYLTNAQEIAPKYVEIYAAFADLFYWKGKPKESLKYLNKAKTIENKNAGILYRLARTQHQLGKITEAKTILKKAEKLAPDHSLAKSVRERVQSN